MSSRSRRDLMELIRRKASMSAQVVSQVDKEYAWYVGADPEIGEQMALLDFMLKEGVKTGLVPKSIIPYIKLYRAYLDQQRKAKFANLCTEITKLGFLLGDRRKVVTAKRKTE